jgi:hypothetical protein
VVNINKVKLTDPNLIWDDVNPRPIRNQRQGARAPVDPLPAQQIHPSNDHEQQATSRPAAQLRPQRAPVRLTGNRRRADSQSSGDNGAYNETADPGTVTPSQDDNQATASSARPPALTRPAPQRSTDDKRLHRQANRRPHQPDVETSAKHPPPPRGYVRPLQDPVLPEAKRTRPLLLRAAKRHLTPPDEETQKKAKLEVIQLVRQCFL